MAGPTDFNYVVGIDNTQAEAGALAFARKIESRPIKLRFDANNLGSITGRVSEFERSLAAANTRVIAFGASAGQIYLMSRALDSLVTSTIEVQKELANINVILNLSSGGIQKFSANLFDVANKTGQSFKTVADTALQFSRQGLGATEVLKRTADAMTLVRIGGTDVDTSVKALTATLNTFNEVGLDSTAILNKIATVDTKFSVSGNVIAEALTRVASTAKDAGVSFDSLIGITTALQQITSRGGSVIGNSLKSIFQRIQRPEVIDQLNQMGVATEDLNGNLLSADTILKNLSKSYGTLSQAQQQQITQLAAGLFQANQFKAIIGDLAKANGIAARATETSGAATDQAARRQAELNKTLATQFNTVINNLQQSAANIGNISIAPALSNIFKGVNFVSANGVGDSLGQGILKGLGNYLSGPGLALIGTLAAKLFSSFATQAASSFARILEVGSARIQNERIIQNLLEQEPTAYEKIAAAGNDVAKVQTIINGLLEKQNLLLNQRVSATQSVAGLTGGSIGGISLSNKPFNIGNERITKNVSGFSSLSTSLSDAISREKAMGVSPSSIRIGTSNQLISSDNPYGMGIYNTKDEPLGLNQGIDRVTKSGADPKRAGNIPSFADFNQSNNPFPFLPDRFLPKATQPFDIRNLVPDSVRFGNPPGIPNQPLLLGAGTGKNAIQLPELTKSTQELNLALENLNKQFSDLIKNTDARKLLPPARTIFADRGFGTGQQFGPTRDDLNRGQLYNYRGGTGIDLRRSLVGNIDLGIGGQLPLTAQANYKELSTQYNQQILDRKNAFNSNIANLNLLNAPFKLGGLKSEATTLGLQGDLKSRVQSLQGQALGASFILPLLGGIAQQGSTSLLGDNSRAARGTTASIGAIANIGSYAATGFALSGGNPLGAAGGAIIGLFTELPAAFKAFSDTLPDLLKHINDLKDSANKTNDAFRGYINASEQLSNVNTGEQKGVTVGQRNALLNQQSNFFNQLPSEAQGKIRAAIKANRPEDVYDIFSSFDTINQQNVNARSDIAALQKTPLGAVSSSTVNGSFVPFNPSRGIFNSQQRAAQNASRAAEAQLRQQGVLEQFNPLANEALGLQNSNNESVEGLLQKLNPSQISTIFNKQSLTTGNNSSITNFLKSSGFSDESIGSFTGLISKISGAGTGGQSFLQNRFSPQSIQNDADNAKIFEAANVQREKTLNDLNDRLVQLTITGTKAVSDFETNVITKLSQSLTELRKQNISDETAARIAQIRGGDNDYTKTYFDFIKSNEQAQNTELGEISKANADFSNKVGKSLLGLFDNFTKGLQGTGKNKPSDLTSLANNKGLNLNSILGNSFNINNETGVVGLTKTDYSKEDVDKIIQNIAEKNKELGQFSQNVPSGALTTVRDALKNSNASSISGISSTDFDSLISFRESIPIIIKANQDLLQKLTQDSADLTKGLVEAKNNLDSEYQINYKQLIDNYKILGAEFTKKQADSLSASSINRQFAGKAFGLSQQASTSNQFNATVLNSQARLQPQLGGIINQLNQSGGFNFGADTTQADIQNELRKQTLSANVQAQFGGGVTSDTQGKLKALTEATNDYSKALQDNQQILDQEISKLTPFTDRLSAFTKEIDINKAGTAGSGLGGTALTGKDYANAAFAPLAYNQQTFQKDTIVGLQDFSQTLKDDLTTSIHQVTAGAKTASEAFRDLAVSLATNVADKIANIGISSLFGLATSALGFNSQNTSKYGFAKGGFVNAGSGVRDDVPAFLSGGEFVLNRSAVSKIGKSNLDSLNNIPHLGNGGLLYANNPGSKYGDLNFDPGVLSDSVSGSSTSIDATLANAYLLSGSNSATTGKSVTSPLISSLGLINSNDPANKIRLARQQYQFGRGIADKTYQQQLAAYNVQQYIGLGQSYLGAIGTIGGAFAAKGAPSSTPPDAFTQFTGGGAGTGDDSGFGGNVNNAITAPLGGYGLNADQFAATQSFYSSSPSANSLSSSGYSSLFGPSIGTAGRIGAAAFRSSGGYIPKFAGGGYFGGDSSSDKLSAMVMGGEYVVSPQTVSKYGKSYFQGLNNAGKYASGGSVGASLYGASDSSSQIINTLTQIRDKIAGTNTPTSSGSPSQGSATNNNITVTVNLSSDSSGNTTSGGTTTQAANQNGGTGSSVSSADKANINKFSQQIKNIVLQSITSESRPGGLLYTTFAKKTT